MWQMQLSLEWPHMGQAVSVSICVGRVQSTREASPMGSAQIQPGQRAWLLLATTTDSFLSGFLLTLKKVDSALADKLTKGVKIDACFLRNEDGQQGDSRQVLLHKNQPLLRFLGSVSGRSPTGAGFVPSGGQSLKEPHHIGMSVSPSLSTFYFALIVCTSWDPAEVTAR